MLDFSVFSGNNLLSGNKFTAVKNLIVNIFPGYSPENSIGGRFLQLHAAHGIAAGQILRLPYGKSWSIDDVSSPANVARKLNREVLQAAARVFGVERDWLDSDSDRIYSTIYWDRTPEKWIESALRWSRSRSRWTLVVFKTSWLSPRESISQNGAAAVLQSIDMPDGLSFQRVQPIISLDFWGNDKQNWLARRAISIADHLGIRVRGQTAAVESLEKFREGKLFYRDIRFARRRSHWDPTEMVVEPADCDRAFPALLSARFPQKARKAISSLRFGTSLPPT